MLKIDIIRFFKIWFPVAVYSGIIFYASSLPGSKTNISITNADKVMHLIEYSPFGFLLARAINFYAKENNNQFLKKNIILLVLIGSFLYGLSDEFHQSFTDGRTSSMYDVFADSIGGILGCLIFKHLNILKI